MNALPKDRVTGVLGIATAVAGALLLGAMAIPADPLGRLIGALIVASVAVGFAGLAVHRIEYPGASMRRGPRSDPLPGNSPEGPLARWSVRDATAWAFEENAPDFAPVISLTEARVARRRTEPERREVTIA